MDDYTKRFIARFIEKYPEITEEDVLGFLGDKDILWDEKDKMAQTIMEPEKERYERPSFHSPDKDRGDFLEVIKTLLKKSKGPWPGEAPEPNEDEWYEEQGRRLMDKEYNPKQPKKWWE